VDALGPAGRALRAFVQQQVQSGGYSTSSEYVRELIRRDQDRANLRSVLLEGAGSALAGAADPAYFATLRARAAGNEGPARKVARAATR
jgi:antitoxin ParD1/3/4